MKRYILDANLFFNMESGLGFGMKTEEVVVGITNIGKTLKQIQKAEFLMPPRVIDEFLSFFEEKSQNFIKNFLSIILVKSPEVGGIQLPAQIIYSIIDEVRSRSQKGQKIAEEEIEEAGKRFMGQKKLETKDFQINIGVSIKKFRDRYRQATRFGFLDSVADLDLFMLARETDGFLVTSDEGVLRWGRMFGVREIRVGVWKKQLEDLLADGVHHPE